LKACGVEDRSLNACGIEDGCLNALGVEDLHKGLTDY
jgi:hypothetical protein